MSEVVKPVANLQRGVSLRQEIMQLNGWVQNLRSPIKTSEGVYVQNWEMGDLHIARIGYGGPTEIVLISKGDAEFELTEDGRIHVGDFDLAANDPETYDSVVTSLQKSLGSHEEKPAEEAKSTVDDVRRKLSVFLEE